MQCSRVYGLSVSGGFAVSIGKERTVLGCHRRHSRCNQAIVPSDTGRPVLLPPAWVASRAIRATAIQVDPLRHADAILVLGGEGFSRYPFGIDRQVDYGVGNDAADVDETG